MSTQHTPGPWKAHPTGLSRSGLPEYQIHWSDIGECVAEIVHGEANARLIAAAPELLEALEMVRDADDDCKRDGLQTIPSMARTRIDRAIAKATGQ
jgi:hypothetical protein